MQPSTFTVHTGDRLLFCTDGLLEARDKAGRYFRPEDCLDTLRNPDLQVAADGLLNRLVAHAGRKLDDDVALLLLEIAPPLAGNEQGPVAALAPGSHAVPGHRPLALAGASAVTVRSAHQLGGLERVRGGVPHERRVSWAILRSKLSMRVTGKLVAAPKPPPGGLVTASTASTPMLLTVVRSGPGGDEGPGRIGDNTLAADRVAGLSFRSPLQKHV
jgi:hypothetical protein